MAHGPRSFSFFFFSLSLALLVLAVWLEFLVEMSSHERGKKKRGEQQGPKNTHIQIVKQRDFTSPSLRMFQAGNVTFGLSGASWRRKKRTFLTQALGIHVCVYFALYMFTYTHPNPFSLSYGLRVYTYHTLNTYLVEFFYIEQINFCI